MPKDAAILELLVRGGMLTPGEAAALPGGFSARVYRDPYALTEAVSELPPPALRWRWETECGAAFCRWVEDALAQRFGIPLKAMAEPETRPALLRLRLDGREEVVDWAYLNSAQWMGSFCTIAARLLLPRGIAAVELETGDLDTVVLFCRSEITEELREVLPVAE